MASEIREGTLWRRWPALGSSANEEEEEEEQEQEQEQEIPHDAGLATIPCTV